MPKEVDLSEFISTRKGPACSVIGIRTQLNADQLEKFEAAMDSPEITSAAIARVVSKWLNKTITPAGIQRHRRKECLCA